MVGFKNPNTFYNKDRYRWRKIFNDIMSFIWSIIVFVLIVIGGYWLIKLCTPWLQALWSEVK